MGIIEGKTAVCGTKKNHHNLPPALHTHTHCIRMQGTVDSHDEDTGMHRVYYADGSEEE